MNEARATDVATLVKDADSPVLRLVNITKSYGQMRANDGVHLTLRRGSVHAILGENGAGKSTLMKILFGVETPDEGSIIINGEPVRFAAPRDAIAAQVGMVFQHFALVGELTALDNIALGAEVSGLTGVKRAIARRRITELSAELGLEVPLSIRVSKISIAQQQRVEILKALYRGARILILDEPTALLAPQERIGLFEAVKRLQATGVSVLFITHKLDEVEYLADDVTVMRLGKVVARHRVGQISQRRLIQDMVGAPQPEHIREHRTAHGTAMSLRDVSVTSTGAYNLTDINLHIRRGEVLGLAGIDGHGHQTLCQLLAGVLSPSGGSLCIGDQHQQTWNRRKAMKQNISYVPEDRLVAGVAAVQSIANNLASNRLYDHAFVRQGLLRRRSLQLHADEMIDQFDIRCADAQQPAARLSGGNVQKVVLAREISVNPDILIVSEPTRGLDIRAISNIHQHLSSTADRGAAVVVQSSDLEEILKVSDRIVVFREGRVVADLAHSPAIDVNRLGEIMLGTHQRGERDDADV